MMSQKLIVPGMSNAKKRPGSSVMILKEQRDADAKWFRVFYCEAWTSPKGTWEVVYRKDIDLCCLVRH